MSILLLTMVLFRSPNPNEPWKIGWRINQQWLKRTETHIIRCECIPSDMHGFVAVSPASLLTNSSDLVLELKKMLSKRQFSVLKAGIGLSSDVNRHSLFPNIKGPQ